MSLIKTSGLTKDFGNRKGAFNVNMDINKGEIVGFIGPNGAGKTTFMLMLTGFIKPDLGKFQIFGKYYNHTNIHTIMPRLGVMLSEVSYNNSLTPRQIFRNSSKLLRMNLKSKWMNLASEFEVELDKKFGELSMGNKKKIGVICALMHDPELVILDEPTSGLDPLIQLKFFNQIRKISEKGGAVFLSSHVLSEVQSACDRILMIKEGKIILEDKTDNILKQTIKIFRVNELPKKILKEIEKHNDVEKVETHGDETFIFTKHRRNILPVLCKNGIHDFYLEKPSLEDMFIEKY